MDKLPPDPTAPIDCALAVALPLSYEDFAEHIRLGGEHDFACGFRRRYPNYSSEIIWDVILGPVVARMLQVIEDASSRGVYVLPNARLVDLRNLFDRYKVVTLFTHWCPGYIYSDQVRDPEAIAARLGCSNLNAIQALRLKVTSDTSPLLPNAESQTNYADRFSRAGNTLLETCDFGPSECPREWHQSPEIAYRVHANRTVLDKVLGSSLIAGNKIEFSDGMRSAAEFTSVIPGTFRGILDLTFCNSVMVAEEIKRIHRFTCLASKKEIDLHLRIEIYDEIIRVISEVPYNYTDAARDVRMAIVDQLCSR
jgi:hypothetical protein